MLALVVLDFVFTMRCYARAVYAVIMCLSVHWSICRTPVLYQNG